MYIVLGYAFAGSCSYISFLPSPSKPPKVIVGLEGIKNQKDRALMQYHSQVGVIFRYRIQKGHSSQFVNFFKKSFITTANKNKLRSSTPMEKLVF